MPRYRVTISSPDREAMLDLVRKHHITVLDHGIRSRRGPAQFHSVDAIVQATEIAGLETKGYVVEQFEDVDEAGRERQKEVGRGNRYLKRPPGGE